MGLAQLAAHRHAHPARRPARHRQSLIALDLAHRIIAGDPWPDGAPMTRPGAPVIYVDGENVPQILNERAVNWQMDRSNLYLLLPDEDDIILDLSQPHYQNKLAEMAYRQEPALIVVDSLGSIMGKGENAIEDVRQILAYLAQPRHAERLPPPSSSTTCARPTPPR